MSKIVVFADSDVGLEVTKFLVKDFYEDIAHVVIYSHDSKIKEKVMKAILTFLYMGLINIMHSLKTPTSMLVF